MPKVTRATKPKTTQSESFESRLEKAEEQLTKAKIDFKAGRLKGFNSVKKIQREIARIKTAQKQEELSQ